MLALLINFKSTENFNWIRFPNGGGKWGGGEVWGHNFSSFSNTSDIWLCIELEFLKYIRYMALCLAGVGG